MFLEELHSTWVYVTLPGTPGMFLKFSSFRGSFNHYSPTKIFSGCQLLPWPGWNVGDASVYKGTEDIFANFDAKYQ